MNFEESELLLNEVNKIYNKIPIKEKTFMEISGYPYYENVCSNILAFYLNPKEEHKLGSLLINSLFFLVLADLEILNSFNLVLVFGKCK